MKNPALIVLAACALSACGSDNNNNSGSSSSGSSSGASSSSSSSSSSGGSSSSSSGSSSGSSSSSSGSSSGSGATAQGIYCGTYSAGTSSSSSSGSSSSSSSGGTGSTFCSSSLGTFFGLVQTDGTAMFFTNLGSSLILYAPASESLTGATFSAVPVTAFGLNGTVVGTSAGGVESGTLNGSATIKTVLTVSTTTLSGTLTGGGAVINFTAASNSGDWNTAASLATVKGSYTATFSVGGTSYAPALAIDGNGIITGSDTTAKDSTGTLCAYTGNVAVHDATHNDYSVTLNSTCLPSSTFTGIAAFFPGGLTNPDGLLGKAALKTGLTDGNSTGIYLNLTQ